MPNHRGLIGNFRFRISNHGNVYPLVASTIMPEPGSSFAHEKRLSKVIFERNMTSLIDMKYEYIIIVQFGSLESTITSYKPNSPLKENLPFITGNSVDVYKITI